jgi:hypothetical protein
MKPSTLLTTTVLMLVASLSGCGQAPRDRAMTEALHYSDPSDQQRLESALHNANIPFEVRRGIDGRDEIWYESRLKEEVARIQGEVFGVSPPMGRSISLGAERNRAFVEELKKRDALFGSTKYQDLEFITWPAESDEAADAALEAISVSSEHIRALKEMRASADAEQRDRTSHSSPSRKEPAPAER